MKTNEQKHTPGPWRENGSVVTAQGSMALVVANVRCQLDPIVRPDAAAKTFAERDANARLIAAAPELLEALKECARLLNVAFDFEGDVFRKEHNNSVDAICAARAAIAKATGKGES